jgi:hypothetical protein
LTLLSLFCNVANDLPEGVTGSNVLELHSFWVSDGRFGRIVRYLATVQRPFMSSLGDKMEALNFGCTTFAVRGNGKSLSKNRIIVLVRSLHLDIG